MTDQTTRPKKQGTNGSRPRAQFDQRVPTISVQCRSHYTQALVRRVVYNFDKSLRQAQDKYARGEISGSTLHAVNDTADKLIHLFEAEIKKLRPSAEKGKGTSHAAVAATTTAQPTPPAATVASPSASEASVDTKPATRKPRAAAAAG